MVGPTSKEVNLKRKRRSRRIHLKRIAQPEALPETDPIDIRDVLSDLEPTWPSLVDQNLERR